MSKPINITPAQERLMTRARGSLMDRLPFIGSVLMATPIEYTYSVPTAATNGLKLMVNPDFFFDEVLRIAREHTSTEAAAKQLAKAFRAFILLHEILHKILEHMTRLGNRNMKKFNVAADYVINWMAKEMGFDVMPGALLDEKYTSKFSAEQVYNMLTDDDMEQLQQQAGDGEIGELGGDIIEAPSSEQADEIEQEIRSQVAQAVAAQQASEKGLDDLPASLRDMIHDVLYPQKSWIDEMAQFFTHKIPDGYDWKRPARRHHASEYFFPRRKTYAAIQRVMIVVDTSGSIDNELLAQFETELNGLRKEIQIESTHVIYCDTRVYEGGEFAAYDDIQFIPEGGGGTNFRPAFEVAEREQPDLLVYFTDLAGRFPESTTIPTLWAAWGTTEVAPFGVTTHIS